MKGTFSVVLFLFVVFFVSGKNLMNEIFKRKKRSFFVIIMSLVCIYLFVYSGWSYFNG